MCITGVSCTGDTCVRVDGYARLAEAKLYLISTIFIRSDLRELSNFITGIA